MKAIEANANIDLNGNIVLRYPLDIKNLSVRVIILLEDFIPKKEKERLFLESFGGWDMKETADEIIQSIRRDRYFRERDIEL